MKIGSMPTSKGAVAIALATTLLLLAAFLRLLRVEILPELPNFSPLMAVALCGAMVLPGWMALAVPLGALAATDLLLNAHYGAPLWGAEDLLRYACYAVAAASGLWLRRKQAGIPAVFGATLLNSLLFYLVTNTGAWMANPAYAQTWAGWVGALTVGVPGFPPTWVFFRNSILGDLGFTAAFLAAVSLAAHAPRIPASAARA